MVWEDVSSFVAASAVEAALVDGCITALRFQYPRGLDPLNAKFNVTAQVTCVAAASAGREGL